MPCLCRGARVLVIGWVVAFCTPIIHADTLKGKQGTVALKVPDGWKPMDLAADLPDTIQLMASNDDQDLGVMVQVEDAVDSTLTLAEYAKNVSDIYKEKFTDVTCTVPKPLKINTADAMQFDIKCTVNGVKLGYLITAFKINNHFEQVDGWSVQSKFDASKPALSKLPAGMKTMFAAGEAPAAPAPVTGPDQVFKGKDGSVQITLPAGWAASDPTDKSVQVSATNDAMDMGLLVTVEDRTNLTWDLKTYAQKVSNMLLNDPESTHGQATKPQHVKVHGADALQFDFHTVRAHIKLAYLITVFQTDKNFLRVSCWSTESKFKALKPKMLPLAEGLREIDATTKPD